MLTDANFRAVAAAALLVPQHLCDRKCSNATVRIACRRKLSSVQYKLLVTVVSDCSHVSQDQAAPLRDCCKKDVLAYLASHAPISKICPGQNNAL